MIPLLALALDAHGGLTRWRQVKSIDLKLSIGGPLWHAKGLPQGLDGGLCVETSKKRVVVSPFDGEDSTGYFTPDRVWVENAAGTVAQKLTSPRGSFSGHDLMTPWSKLQELYFVGYAFLNYLSSPFNLAEPGFEVTEIEPHEEILRRNTSASESGASNRLSSINDLPEFARNDGARSGFPISLPQSAAGPGTHLRAPVPSRIARFAVNNL